MDTLFNLAFGRLANPNPKAGPESQLLEGWFPAVDVYEDKDNLLVKAELPGLRKEDVEIAFHNGYLTLSGERKQEQKHEDAETYRSERWLGRFHRTISLPCRVEADKIKRHLQRRCPDGHSAQGGGSQGRNKSRLQSVDNNIRRAGAPRPDEERNL